MIRCLRTTLLPLAAWVTVSPLALNRAAAQERGPGFLDSSKLPPRFELTVIDTFGGDRSIARALNEGGQVVGWAEVAGGDAFQGSFAFLWENGQLQNLGALPGDVGSWASDINENGVIVGTSRSAQGDQLAWVYENGAMRSIGTLGGPWSSASAIDDQNAIVGWALPPSASRRFHAFRFETGLMTGLGTVAQGVWSGANDVNSAGVLVGYAQDDAASQQAMQWTPVNGMQVLPNLGGMALPSSAQAVNALGDIVGWAKLGEIYLDPNGTQRFTRHAALWRGGAVQDLGTLGGDNSSGEDINRSGDIVGWSENAAGERRAFLRRGGRIYDLNELVRGTFKGVLAAALAINDRGQIVGELMINDRRARGFLLTPLP